MTTITKSIVIDTLRSIVEEYGEDYVYPKEPASFASPCSYARGGVPSCIVGHLINRLDSEGFKKVAMEEESEGESFPADAAIQVAGLEVDRAAENILIYVQDEQDSGTAWGTALRVAIERVNGESEA